MPVSPILRIPEWKFLRMTEWTASSILAVRGLSARANEFGPISLRPSGSWRASVRCAGPGTEPSRKKQPGVRPEMAASFAGGAARRGTLRRALRRRAQKVQTVDALGVCSIGIRCFRHPGAGFQAPRKNADSGRIRQQLPQTGRAQIVPKFTSTAAGTPFRVAVRPSRARPPRPPA